jgi:hypothetical protein
MKRFATVVCVVGVLAGSAAAQDAVQWRVEDGGNGHWYQLTHSPGISWSDAAASALTQGGQLATLTSEHENAFVVARLQGHPSRYPWFGLKQSATGSEPASGWGWISGEPLNWSNWSPSEPNGDGVTFADEGNLWLVTEPGRPLGTWNDWTTGGPDGYLIEWSADCNSDGIVDFGQIRSGELDDANLNNIPDCCEAGVSCIPCEGDVSGNGVVDGVDLAAVLGAWGSSGKGEFSTDTNGDGFVDGADLATVLSGWGPCPN